MKKVMTFAGLIAVFLLVTMTSFAEMAKKPITKADLASLKGKWTGQRMVKGVSNQFPVTMEITNEKIPLQGKLTLQNVMKKGLKGRTEVIGLEKSRLTKDGKLSIKTATFQIELALSTEGDKKQLEGNYKFEELDGTVILDKK